MYILFMQHKIILMLPLLQLFFSTAYSQGIQLLLVDNYIPYSWFNKRTCLIKRILVTLIFYLSTFMGWVWHNTVLVSGEMQPILSLNSLLQRWHLSYSRWPCVIILRSRITIGSFHVKSTPKMHAPSRFPSNLMRVRHLYIERDLTTSSFGLICKLFLDLWSLENPDFSKFF